MSGSTLIPHRIEHDLAAEFSALAAHRSRAALERSQRYQVLRSEIERVTRATEYWRNIDTPGDAARSFIRVAAWNLERGRNIDKAIAFLRSHSLLKDADVLLLSEVDNGMERSGNRHVTAELASTLGYDYVFGNSYISLDGVRDGARNEVGIHGNAVLSRLPIRRADNISVSITKDKFASSEPRLGHKKALAAELETPFGPTAVAVAHLDSHGSPEQRAAMLRDTLVALDERGYPSRRLVGGDLNTSTYDVQSLWRLFKNVLAKLLRGGFAHAIEHYMRPYQLYERPVFDTFDEHGFDWRSFNDLEAPTFRYEVGEGDSEEHVRGYLPGIFVSLLRWKLAPWGGVAPLKIDWFAARGLRALDSDEHDDLGGKRTSSAPFAVPKPTVDGTRISDHDPIAVDIIAADEAR